jgi:hypothetical protein
MTLAEIKTFTTSKLGITDAAALAQAELFVKHRWRMLWNTALWRQTRWQATVSVAAGTQDVTLPTEFDFVTAMRWAGQQELVGVSDLSALASDPAGYDQSGPVLAFIPLAKDTDGNCVVRLLQKPKETKSLLVIGKRKCVELSASTDSPLIPGADQVLCEAVMGDLYEWIRQLSKAQVFFSKATTLIEKMKEIETAQASEIRRIIPIEQQLDADPQAWLSN